MESIAGGSVWRSEHERVPTTEELALEAAWEALDREFGARAAARYGTVPDTSSGRGLRRTVIDGLDANPAGHAAMAAARRFRDRREAARLLREPRAAFGRFGDDAVVVTVPETAADGAALLDRIREPFLVLVRPGAEALESGLRRILEVFRTDDLVGLAYADSVTTDGSVVRPPAYSELRLLEEDYLGPLIVVRMDMLRAIGGFRSEADGAQLLDIVLRLRPADIARLRIVAGVGSARGLPAEEQETAAADVIRDALASRSVEASVSVFSDRRRIDYQLERTPRVSILIPTRGGAGEVAGRERIFVVEAVRGILERSTWPELEIVVVADDATPQAVIDELMAVAGDRLVLARWTEAFNFSRKMNRAAVLATGDYLLMLNDDVDVITPDWIEQMLMVAERPGIGAVGALLFFEDGAVQHVGHLYQYGQAGHAEFGVVPGPGMPIGRLTVTREVSGATAACLLVASELFREVGGFSVLFPGNFNDVDLCLKVRETGAAIAVAGRAELYHFESRTRDATVLDSERAALVERWGDAMQRDEWSRERDR